MGNSSNYVQKYDKVIEELRTAEVGTYAITDSKGMSLFQIERGVWIYTDDQTQVSVYSWCDWISASEYVYYLS